MTFVFAYDRLFHGGYMELKKPIAFTLFVIAFSLLVTSYVNPVQELTSTATSSQDKTTISENLQVESVNKKISVKEYDWQRETIWSTFLIIVLSVIVMILAILIASQWFRIQKILSETKKEIENSKEWRKQQDIDIGKVYSYLAQLQIPTGMDADYKQIIYARLSVGRLAKYVKDKYTAGKVFENSFAVLRNVFKIKKQSIKSIIGEIGWDMIIGRTLKNLDEASKSLSGTALLEQIIHLKDYIEREFPEDRVKSSTD